MTVYVDKARNNYQNMIMCHMIADTIEELHAMADTIGVQRRWFQDKPSAQHYDIALSKRHLAIKNGAVELDRRQFVEVMRILRNKRIKELLTIAIAKET